MAVTIGLLMVAGFCLLSAPPVRAAQIEIKLGHADPVDVYTSRKAASSMVFKQIVESETGGAIEVKVFPAGQVGGERDLAEAPLCRGSSGNLHPSLRGTV